MMKFRQLLIGLLALLSLLLSTAIWAAPIIAPTSTWAPAQAGRTWMDIGGVWDGTQEVTNTTGDTVTFSLDNTQLVGVAHNAYEIAPSALLPVGINYVAGTASVVTTGTNCTTPAPTITATQTGTLLSFSLAPLGYDLYSQCKMSIQYGITVAPTVMSGTYQITHQWDYAATQGGALSGVPSAQLLNILVQGGATVISKSPVNQIKRVNATATWNVDVQNTGLGGLFDVSVDEYTINPSPSLTMTSMVATAPAAPSATVVAAPTTAKRQLTYLAPGAIFKNAVNATVTACKNINNTVYTTDRTGKTAKSGSAQVTLDKVLPVIALTVNNYTLAYNAVTPMSVTIQNTGLGDAGNFRLQSTLNTQGMTVSNVAPGWTYNAATGLFTYSAGTVAAGATVALTFDVAANNVCTLATSLDIGWTALYSDPCGDAYNVPTVSNTLSLPTASRPTMTLTNQSVAAGTTTPVVDRFAVGTPARFIVNFSATNANLVNGISFVVQDTLPLNITGITLIPPTGTTATCPAAVCVAGDVVTWTIPKASLPLAGGLLIDYTTPTGTCSGGTSITNSALVNAAAAGTTGQTCALTASASTSPLITNNLAAAAVTQTFNVGTPLAGAFFETGGPTASTIPTRAASGDGEFIPFTANYTFGAGAGTWAGSTFKDDFAGSGATLVPNTLKVSVNGGAAVAVPAANVICGAGTVAGNNCSGNMTIDLAFLAGAAYVNNANVAATTLQLTYQTTIPDTALGGVSSRRLTQLATLTLAGGATGGCPAGPTQTYTLGAFVPVARAEAKVSLSMPATIDVCEPAIATMTVFNATEEFPSNVRAIFPTVGSYNFPTPQTPVYGGLFSVANMTYAPNGGTDPTFTLTPKLSANGTIQFVLQLKRGSSTTPVAAQVQVDYDDYQTAPTPVRDFYATGQFAPALVRKGQLAVSMTPQRYTVINNTASWKIFVTNLGDGTAFGATLDNVLPAGMTLDTVATDAANTGQCSPLATCNATLTGQTVSWALGDIAPGSTRTLTLNALLTGNVCSIPDGSNSVTAKWGCGGVTLGPPTVLEPNFLFPAGQMQVVHDTTGTFAPMCGTGKDVIIVRNTGVPDILDVYAQEVLNTATTGLTFVPDTVQYSIDGGLTWSAPSPAYNPTGLGTTASPYTWSKAQIPPLADLYSATGGGVNEVRIRFDITVGEKANITPSITASGHGVISCGNPVSSPGAAFNVPVRKPNIVVTKTGINRTVTPTGGTYGNLVFGGQGDVVEWKVTVQNTGTVNDSYTAYNMRFGDTFAGSGALTMNVYSQPLAAPLGATIADGAVYTFPDLPVGGTQTYLFRETLGATCSNWGSENIAKVSWGCVNNGAAIHSNLTLPSSTGKAGLVMQPGFGDFTTSASAQTIIQRSAGREKITVYFYNGGATAQSVQLTGTAFPANMMLDPYGSVTVTGTAVNTTPGACVTAGSRCLDGTVTLGGTPTAPVFTLNGSGMRHATDALLTFHMVPSLADDLYATAYPALTAVEPNAANNQLDPLAGNYGGNLSLSLSSPSTCTNPQTNVNTKFVDPLIPDLDMTVSPAYAIVSDGYTMNFDFTFQNAGEAGSTAELMQVRFPIVGGGVTVNSVNVIASGTGGWLQPCGQVAGIWTCGEPSLWATNLFGYALPGASMKVRVNVTLHDNGQPLTLVGEVTGQVISQGKEGNGAAGNPKVFLHTFSHDHAAPRMVGINFKKTLVSTSEVFTLDPYAAIGEELTYDLYARFFGGDAALAPIGGVFQNVVMRDTLPAGLGLVSLTPQANNTLPAVVSGTATPAGSNPLKAGVVNMSVTPYANTTALTFDYYATARVLNTAGNVDGTSLFNSFGGSLSYQGQMFHSNHVADGFAGGIGLTHLHAEYTAVVQRPTVTIAKTVRNVTAGGAFAPTATGSAGDTYEYKVVLTNTSTTAPAYDLKVVDNLPTTLVLLDGATDGVDNDGDGLVDATDAAGEGQFTVVAAPAGGGSIVFNDVYAAIATAGANFAKLNPGSTITLLYRAVGNPAKVGAASTVVNTATATYTTLPGTYGTAMSAPLRASGLVDGEGSTDVYSQASIVMTSRVSGTVYLDANKNSVQDGAEAGTALTLYVKLINNAGVGVYAQAVDPVTGGFAFPSVAAGTYHTILDTNAILADVTATIPPSWVGTQTPNQIRAPFTLAATGSKAGEDFGLYQSNSTFFNGRVFEDNGAGVGTAHNVVQDGVEKGLPQVKVELTDCSTNIYATAYTNGSGDFSLPLLQSLNIANGSTLCIRESNPAAYTSTGAVPGTLTGGAYTVSSDQYSFVLNTAALSYTGINFGDIAPNTFLTDNVGTALPGSTKFYPHVFKASTAGSVRFTSSFSTSVSNPAWNNVLYQDSNCNQRLDAGEPQLTPSTLINTVADQYTCILDKQFIPSNIAYDSRVVATIQASFTYAPVGGIANANLPLSHYTRTDTTIVGQEDLTLHKAVDKPTAKPGDLITYTITYTNPTQGALGNLVIHDTTPAYTLFSSAACGTPLGKGLTTCTPSGPASGTTGSIQWTMAGSLQPGGSGSVSYQVVVAP